MILVALELTTFFVQLFFIWLMLFSISANKTVCVMQMDLPVVEVDQGSLRGTNGVNHLGENYLRFHGIPYAKPPVRFLEAESPIAWDGVRDATQEKDGCRYRNVITNELVGSEDCLYLNVYTKKLPANDTKLKPVMVWFHGGAFVLGNASMAAYDPAFLLTEDIVLVTLTFRLGIIGFSNPMDPNTPVSSNLGIKDQRLALRWVQNNIKYFGGHPDNVTIFGESAGASSCHYHILSENSRGLFHKAIIQSGSALSVFGQGDFNMIKIVEKMGHKVKNEREAFKILAKAPIDEIYLAQEKFGKFALPAFKRLVGPSVEPPGTPESVITQPAIDIITSGQYNDVPCIFGYNADEGISIDFVPQYDSYLERLDCRDMIPFTMGIDRESELAKTLAARIKEKYFGDGIGTRKNLHEVISDSMFIMWIISSIKLHSKISKHPIYAYKMTVDTQLNLTKQNGQTNQPGVCHADDLGYLFKNSRTPEIRKGSIEDISWRRVVKLWTNFAKFGNPTLNKKELGVLWEPVGDLENIKTLIIGEELKMETNPDKDRVEFWKSITKESPHTVKFM